MPCLTESHVQASTRAWPLTSQLVLGPLPSAVPVARGHTIARLWEWDLDRMRDDVTLCVSELVTNAVAASCALNGGPWPLRFSLASDGAELLICVADMNPEPPVRADAADSDAIDGRGLLIVEALSEQWGFYRAGSGKVVWAVCALQNS
jgi:anti-sigma regulatory factor (Ser/Thr protein kinase)